MFLSRLSTAPLTWSCTTWRSSLKLSSLTWNSSLGVYVSQAGHRALFTFHPLALFDALEPLFVNAGLDLTHFRRFSFAPPLPRIWCCLYP